MFKSKIEEKAKEGMVESYTKWYEFAKNDGHLDKKPLPVVKKRKRVKKEPAVALATNIEDSIEH
jgi:site-specific recombinase XerD